MNADPITVCRKLEQGGATIVVRVEAAASPGKFVLDPADAEDFLADPRGWAARQWGVTAVQLDEWSLNDYLPRCSAITKAGHRCRNALSAVCDPPQFIEMHGGICHVHE